MRFINRETELSALNKHWRSNSAEFIVVYGKRRVGKTELTIQFAKNKPHIYFLAERMPLHLQAQKFSQALARHFGDDYLVKQGLTDWEEIFKYIASKKKKMVIIIDEFPYLVEAESGITTTFQKAWDLYLKKSKIFLILCGSSISMMEQHALAYRSPLYGRRTGQMLVKPFRFGDLENVFPKKSFDDRLTIFSMVGGTITYLKNFEGKQSLWKVIEKRILQKDQFLYEEVEFLLREELKEPRNYFAILLALSLGKTKLSEILNETGFDKGTASRYLSILNSLSITEKEIPITEKIPEKSRKGIYRIADNYFNFWFRFVFRNRSEIEEGSTDKVLGLIRKSITELQSKNYERVAQEILLNASLSNRIPMKIEEVGRWWDKNEEIDIVGVNSETNEILLGEVKWSNKPIGTDIYENLKRKSSLVEWGKKDRKERFCLFSKSGFTPDMVKTAKNDGIFLFHKEILMK